MHNPPDTATTERPNPQPDGCGVCTAPTGDDGRLCRLHTDELARDLASVPGLVVDLQVTTTRQDRISADKHGSASATKPLPWNEHASGRAFELNATLNAWALDVSRIAEDDRDQLIEQHHSDTVGVARWLRRNLATLRRHPEAGTASDEITDAIREARRAVDKPLDLAAYGPCGNTGGDDQPHPPCPEYLYAAPNRTTVSCRACGAHHDTAARKTWMLDYVRDMLGTTTEVASYLGLAGVKTTPDAIRAYASRGRITAVGIDSNRRPLYRYADVITAISERYTRKPKAA